MFFFASCVCTLNTNRFLIKKHRNRNLQVSLNKFPDFFRMGTYMIVHTWNSSALRSNPPPAAIHLLYHSNSFWKAHGSPLVWANQWPSSQPLSSPQFERSDRDTKRHAMSCWILLVRSEPRDGSRMLWIQIILSTEPIKQTTKSMCL